MWKKEVNVKTQSLHHFNALFPLAENVTCQFTECRRCLLGIQNAEDKYTSPGWCVMSHDRGDTGGWRRPAHRCCGHEAEGRNVAAFGVTK